MNWNLQRSHFSFPIVNFTDMMHWFITHQNHPSLALCYKIVLLNVLYVHCTVKYAYSEFTATFFFYCILLIKQHSMHHDFWTFNAILPVIRNKMMQSDTIYNIHFHNQTSFKIYNVLNFTFIKTASWLRPILKFNWYA